jgi:hypothetical protein
MIAKIKKSNNEPCLPIFVANKSRKDIKRRYFRTRCNMLVNVKTKKKL